METANLERNPWPKGCAVRRVQKTATEARGEAGRRPSSALSARPGWIHSYADSAVGGE